MPWITVADSDIGGRDEQQDRYLVKHSDDGENHLLVVADGAGGHKAGAMAAQTAVDCINQHLESVWSSDDPDTFLSELIIECNERVRAVGDGELACTTLVLVLIKGDEIFWGHVGDSRFYLIRNRQVFIRTTDHSVVELQRQRAAQNSDIVVNAPLNELYMCLGTPADIDSNMESSLARDGDTLLLCSDGLWGQVDMNQLVAELGEQPLTIESLKAWTTRAKLSKLDNSDNITLVAARLINKPSLFSNPIKAMISLFRKQRTN